VHTFYLTETTDHFGITPYAHIGNHFVNEKLVMLVTRRYFIEILNQLWKFSSPMFSSTLIKIVTVVHVSVSVQS
jgi:hypothetical protein